MPKILINNQCYSETNNNKILVNTSLILHVKLLQSLIRSYSKVTDVANYNLHSIHPMYGEHLLRYKIWKEVQKNLQKITATEVN